MAKIWDISKIPLPFQDLIGTDSHNNEYAEWTKDKLAAPTLANALIDGADAPTDSNCSARGWATTADQRKDHQREHEGARGGHAQHGGHLRVPADAPAAGNQARH